VVRRCLGRNVFVRDESRLLYKNIESTNKSLIREILPVFLKRLATPVPGAGTKIEVGGAERALVDVAGGRVGEHTA
jgi:hypothetical protein